MNNNTRSSFTAADSMPVKLMQDYSLIRSIVEDHVIPPIHAQLIPTNKCNLNCSFCSCANEDRSLEMSIQDLDDVVDILKNLGMKSVTITGGGDPLCHPNINGLIMLLRLSGIEIGLVSNVVLINRIEPDILKQLTWFRISYADDRKTVTTQFKQDVVRAVYNAPNVGWAFSYVVSQKPNIPLIKEIIALADVLKFTHVRLVADLLCPEEVPMAYVEQELALFLSGIKVPVLFQGRDTPEKGSDCYIGYLKPVIAPDMKVYACCGVQYALATPSKTFPPELCLGSIYDFRRVILEQSHLPFEGAKNCVRCYYGNYNRTLSMLLSSIVHREFV